MRICENGSSVVHVVVNFDAALSPVCAKNAANILHDLAFRLHREDLGSVERSTRFSNGFNGPRWTSPIAPMLPRIR